MSPTPEHQSTVAVIPERVVPTGLGGFVGINADPIGDIQGRRVHARLIVTVRAPDLAAIGPAGQSVSTALLGAGQVDLRGQGILRLSLDDLGEAVTTGQGSNEMAVRDLGFKVLYEHLQLPEAGEGVIATVPLMIDTASTDRGGRVVLSEAFMAASLDRFEVFDDPLAVSGGASRWEYEAAEQRIRQRSNIRGGPNSTNPNKPGTYLVLRTTATIPPLRDFVLSTELSTDDVDTVGLVFRWQDVDNFMFVLLDARTGYRMLARKVGGAFQTLSPAALVTEPGLVVGQRHLLRVAAQGSSFRVHVDGEMVLEATDSALPDAGRVGLMCRANPAAFFYRLDLTEL